jgi:mannosyltransferase
MATMAPPSLPASGEPSVRAKWLPDYRTVATSLSLITLLAFLLRWHGLGEKSFWLDEAVSVEIARLHWSDFFLILWHREANMAAYYSMLRFWLLLGDSEGFVRGLSVLFSIATVPIVYLLGARLFSRTAGLLAAWLLAINAYHVRYAQEARGYAMVVFFAAVATLLLVQNVQEPLSARWGAYTAACALAVYSHFYGGLVVLAHVASLAGLRQGDVPWQELRRSLVRFAFLVLPLGAAVLHIGTSPVNWIPRVQASAVLKFFMALAGNNGARLLALEAIALLLSAYWAWNIGGQRERTLDGWGYVLVFAWLLVPVFVVLAASLVRPLFLGRYLNPCLPALVLVVAAGIIRLRPAILAWGLGGVISAFSLLGVVSYYQKDFDINRDDWRAASSFIFDEAQPGDGVFYLNFFGMPLQYYRSQRHPAPAWPQVLNSAEGTQLNYRDFLVTSLGERLRDARPAGKRVWLILELNYEPNGQPSRANTVLRAIYGKGRHLVEERTYRSMAVLLFEGDAADTRGESPPARMR